MILLLQTLPPTAQFLMIRRDAYDAVGGHAGVAAEVLEDVAFGAPRQVGGLSPRVPFRQGHRSSALYRSFASMWEGWTKNLYMLIGGTPKSVFRELDSTFPWIVLLVLLLGIKFPFALFAGVWLLIFRQINYGSELTVTNSPSLSSLLRTCSSFVRRRALGLLPASCPGYGRMEGPRIPRASRD